MLSKIASAGTNGQFRTPRHIIKLMVEKTAPQPDDEICDPACGTAEDTEKYTLILANPPFAGSLDYESTSKYLQRVVKTKKTELLFLALFLKLLKPGGRAAVIVPDGVLFGSSKAHKELRKILVEDQKLDAVVAHLRFVRHRHRHRTGARRQRGTHRRPHQHGSRRTQRSLVVVRPLSCRRTVPAFSDAFPYRRR